MRIALLGKNGAQTFALRSALLAAGHTAQHYDKVNDFLNAVNQTGFETLILCSLGNHAETLSVLVFVRYQLKLTVPIFVVATDNDEDYIVTALRTGADDCVVEPVRQREFLARLEAVARRWINDPPTVRLFRIGQLTVNVQSRRIFFDDTPVTLTSKDFDLALFLLSNVGRLISRNQILRAVWGANQQQLIRSRTLDTHISRVRTRLKLLEPYGWRLAAVYRRGYRLEQLKDLPKKTLSRLNRK